MKKLDKSQSKKKVQLADEIRMAAEILKDEITDFNSRLYVLYDKVMEHLNKYNEVIEEANSFIEEVNSQQEGYASERSDAWESHDGEDHAQWRDEWSISLDEVELDECPELLMPDFDGDTLLEDLPEEPS